MRPSSQWHDTRSPPSQTRHRPAPVPHRLQNQVPYVPAMALVGPFRVGLVRFHLSGVNLQRHRLEAAQRGGQQHPVDLIQGLLNVLHRTHPAQPLADGHRAGNAFQTQHRQQRLVVPLKPVHIVQPERARVPRQNECPDINRGRQARVAAGLGEMPVDTCREAQAVHQLRRRQQAGVRG